MRPVVFSASSVNSYLTCHLQWWFTHVLAERGLESEQQRVGLQAHDYAERTLRQLGTGYITPDTSPRPEVKALLRVWDRDILPTYRNPILIEAEFQLEINGIPYSGVIDSVDEHHIGPVFEIDWDSEGRDLIDPGGNEWDAWILRDLKTTGSRPAKGKYRLNMIGYWLGATDLLGREPDAAQLDWIVRTKNPYYWPEVVEPIDEDDIANFAATLERVAEGVAKADYEPTGLGTWACKPCPYRHVCGPYQRYQEATEL